MPSLTVLNQFGATVGQSLGDHLVVGIDGEAMVARAAIAGSDARAATSIIGTHGGLDIGRRLFGGRVG